MSGSAKIAFQGELGANSHEACRVYYPDHEPRPCATFEEAFEAVKSGECALGMIPVENSIAGRVADVHHLLPSSGLKIIGERFKPISFQLMANPGTRIEDIRTVSSMPIAIKGRAGEVERPSPRAVRGHRQDGLDDVRIAAVIRTGLQGHRRGDIATGLLGQESCARAQRLGRHERHVALQVDHHIVPSGRIQHPQRRQDPVRSRRQGRIGEDRPAAGVLHRLGDLDVAGRDRDWPYSGGCGLAHHAHDHRQSADVRQRLSGETGRGHARWDDDDGVHVAF